MAPSKLNNNVTYLKQQLAALLGNTSRIVKFICLTVIVGYALSFWEEGILLLSVTPGHVLPPSFKIWTLFTFCFLEIHIWEVVTDILIVGLCGKLLEPLWGNIEMITFFFIVNTGAAVLSSFFYLFLFVCSSNPDLLFKVHIHGLAGYVAGVTVAVKQIMPDIQIVKTSFGRITNKHIPIISICFSIILWLSGLFEGTSPTMFAFGIFVSWIYLRFYQNHSNGTKGDMTDSFSFASFFPTVLQPAVSVFANLVYNLLIQIKICKRRKSTVITENPSHVTVSSPTTELLHEERRKQLAMRELSERLTRKSDKSGSIKSSEKLLGPTSPVKMKPQSQKKSSDVVIPMLEMPPYSENAYVAIPPLNKDLPSGSNV